ncbi:hypothetical protein F6X40_27405 [Paraburkholderia sp. UCT31]|uniref:hypothetical protein n=1 Tax=Paraburkholderia sp. UCT31 TaxID=2615209 RepID=UPI001655ADAA|nr:hypothetical protein [Paraburkholderia sp. UCT31]MBC8740388.1 hypothetical protein [Paraburkholderia sp. UCT31]
MNEDFMTQAQPLFTAGPEGFEPTSATLDAWLTQFATFLRNRCQQDAPALWPYRYEGSENLALDYSGFSMTLMLGESTGSLPTIDAVAAANSADIGVADMTDALALVSAIEQRRQQTNQPVIELVTPAL